MYMYMRDDLYRTVDVKEYHTSMPFLCTHDDRLWLESSTTSWPRMTWRSLKSWSWPVTAACVSWAGAYRDTLPAAHPPWQPSSLGSLTSRSPPLQTTPILLSGYYLRYMPACVNTCFVLAWGSECLLLLSLFLSHSFSFSPSLSSLSICLLSPPSSLPPSSDGRRSSSLLAHSVYPADLCLGLTSAVAEILSHWKGNNYMYTSLSVCTCTYRSF